MSKQLEPLVMQVAEKLLATRWTVATVESCTGGWIAQALTSVDGSSKWFERGFVTYSNEAKTQQVGVTQQSLVQHGAVSRQVVREMSLGGIASSRADIAIAVTGIAGPGGGTAAKPVGTVWIGWADKTKQVFESHFIFEGDRTDIRLATVEHALIGTVSFIDQLQ